MLDHFACNSPGLRRVHTRITFKSWSVKKLDHESNTFWAQN